MEISNPRIISFYKENPNFDFEMSNLIMIDFLEKISQPNKAPTINSQVIKDYFQDPLCSLIMKSEERIIHTLKDVPKKVIQNSGYHFKYVLNQLYCTSDIIQIANNYSLYTISMKRPQKPKIIFANKDSDLNIEIDDIDNFIRFIEENNSNGIFVSQHSGISCKPNFHIDYIHGNIIVYIHNTDYSPDKIKIAIDIIDTLSGRLRDVNSENNENSIPTAMLEDINKEYQLFISQKEAVISVFKESQKKVLSQIDELRFPNLDKFLSTKFTTPIQKQGFKCDLCKSFNANNLKALAAHKRGCIRKNVISVASTV